MNFISVFYVISFYLWDVFLSVDANAMLKPSHRGTMWTRKNYNTGGYNYMGINCGGISRFKQNNGKCGLCGDPYNGARNHETGGKYATGAIAEVIGKGQRNIYAKILLNSDQGGYFEFRLCVTNGTAETQACFDKHLLKISEGRLQGDEFSYYVDRAGVIPLTVEIPDQVYCDRCVLQWKYITGNTFGRDEHGVGCLGCGHQETYINCADIRIKGWEIPTTPPPPSTPIPTTVWWTTTVAPTTRPPPPPPTTTTPVPTTAAKVVTKNTHPSTKHGTRQRQPATDFDEGSRRRSQYARYTNAYGSVPAPAAAPKKQSIVPASIFRSNSLDAPKKNLQKGIAVPLQVQPVTVKTPGTIATTTVKIIPKVEKVKPSILPKRQSGPFKIPRPPRLTLEQINALNNNKDVQPGHDPLQKYANVGSSRIVAAVDFTTVRAQQVATPPTTSKIDRFNIKSTHSTVIQNGHINSAPAADNKMDIFSSFGNEMMGDPSPTDTPMQPIQNFGSDLINEYGIIPSVSPKGNFVVQNKDVGNNRRMYSGEFTSSNSKLQNSQVSHDSNYMQENVNSNRHFSSGLFDLQQSRSYVSNPQAQRPDSLASSNYVQKLSKDKLPLNAKHSLSPEQTRTVQVPETDMFGGNGYLTVFQNHSPHQNSFNTGSVDRYGQMSKTGSKSNTYDNNHNQEQIFMKRMPIKTTKLPVVDTSTHKTGKKSNSADIAPWRNHQINLSKKENTHTIQDIPVNLFKDKKRNTFKPPVVFERFTNYQVGGSQKKPNALPESLIKANKARKQETLESKSTNENLHLNTGLHSPEKYFGQDHYIAHDVELSNQAFGGPNSPDYINQPSFNSGQIGNVQEKAGWQSQETHMQAGWESQHVLQQPGGWQSQQGATPRSGWQSEQAALSQAEKQSQDNWNSNTMSHTQGGWQTQDSSQSFANDHLNAALHSPQNYFPQMIQQRQSMTGPYQSFWDPTATPEPSTTTTQRTTTTTTTQAPTTTTTRRPTTQAAPTTDIIQYQMNELKRLREKMERLQRLLTQRNVITEVSTSISPSQVVQQTNTNQQTQNGISQATVDVPQAFNKNNIYVDSKKTYMNNDNVRQQKNNNAYHIPTDKRSNQLDIMRDTSTLPPGMSKQTTKYIQDFKEQMLLSIIRANEHKEHHMSRSSATDLQNMQNNNYDTKVLNNDVSTTSRVRGHQSQLKEKISQNQQEINYNYQEQQQQREQTGLHVENTNVSPTNTIDEEKKRKYRRILELLIERKRQKAANQNKVRKNNPKQEQISKHYQTDVQQTNGKTDKQYDTNPNRPNIYENLPQNSYEQSLQGKPILAEMKTNSFRKEKIVQRPDITSVRPVETIDMPATEVTVEANTYQPNAVKTTIDKLANRLAASMAEKLASKGKNGGRNFHVLPLSSDSVMAALRNIAAKVLKSKSNKIQSKPLDNNNPGMHQLSTKPILDEVNISKGVKRQTIVHENHQTTELNKRFPSRTASSQTTLSTEQRRSDNMSQEKLARRKELIRKMKEMMLSRRQMSKENTKTVLQQTETKETSNKITNMKQYKTPADFRKQNDMTVMTSNGKSAHEVKISTTEKVDTNNRSPTTYVQSKQASQRFMNPSKKQNIVKGISPTSATHYSNNNKNEGRKANMRVSPDIARSMLSRVRSMLASQKSNNGEKNFQAMSNKDVLVMPLNKEMLFKLIQSMKKKKESIGR